MAATTAARPHLMIPSDKNVSQGRKSPSMSPQEKVRKTNKYFHIILAIPHSNVIIARQQQLAQVITMSLETSYVIQIQ